MSLRVFVSFGFLCVATVPGIAQNNHTWTTYVNDRFGESICYPADMVRAAPAPENDDGLAFIAKDGAKIATWGSYVGPGSTLEASAQEDAKRLAGPAGKVTYKIVRKNFYIVSGRNGDVVFYNRTSHLHDVYSSVEITYPEADSLEWDAIAAHVSRCFRPGSGD